MAQYPPATLSGVSAGAALTLTYTPRGSLLNKVSQVSTEMPGTVGGASAATGLCVVRRNGAIVAQMIPSGDTAAGDPPIWLWPGDTMTIEWTSVPNGLTGRATVFYDLDPNG